MTQLEYQTNSENSIWKVLKQRNISFLCIGQLFSLCGDKIYQLSLIWLSYQMSNSSFMTGLVAMATSIPALLFSLLSGALADHFNKKRIMIIADLIRAIAASIIPISYYLGILSIPIFIGVAFIMGTMSQLFNPAYRSIIPNIVNKEDLLKTNSIFSTIEQIMGFVGPSVATALLLLTSKTSIFFITSITYFISVLMITLLNGVYQSSSNKSDILSHTREAFNYVRKNEVVFTLILFGGIINLFLSGILAVIPPLYSSKILHAGKAGYGLLVSSMSAGMLLGAVGINLFKKIGRGKLFILGFLGTGISFILIGLTNIAGIVYPLFVLFGFFMLVVNITFATLLQSEVDPSKLGVVISLVSLMGAGLSPLSSAMTGFLAGFISPSYFYLVCGCVMSLVGILSFKNRAIRQV